MARTVTGGDATHRLTVVDPSTIGPLLATGLAPNAECWEARLITQANGHRWGRRAQFCFDRGTGAPLFRRILSETRLEVLIVRSVSAEVDRADLEPR